MTVKRVPDRRGYIVTDEQGREVAFFAKQKDAADYATIQELRIALSTLRTATRDLASSCRAWKERGEANHLPWRKDYDSQALSEAIAALTLADNALDYPSRLI